MQKITTRFSIFFSGRNPDTNLSTFKGANLMYNYSKLQINKTIFFTANFFPTDFIDSNTSLLMLIPSPSFFAIIVM